MVYLTLFFLSCLLQLVHMPWGCSLVLLMILKLKLPRSRVFGQDHPRQDFITKGQLIVNIIYDMLSNRFKSIMPISLTRLVTCDSISNEVVFFNQNQSYHYAERLKILAPLCHPIRNKTKINRDSLIHFFPRFFQPIASTWSLIGSLYCPL